MERLNAQSSFEGKRNTSQLKQTIMQFGEGNFLRAFVDWMINELNKKDIYKGSCVLVQPIEQGMVSWLQEQDYLYNLLLRGVENGEVKNEQEVIQSISHGINPYSDWSELITYATKEEMRFVVSNTTEAGITFSEEEYIPGQTPNTFPAKITACLFERFKTYNGATDKGFVFLPCELIDRNGDKLKTAVLQYCELWNLGEDFRSWVNEANTFCNTLVDRIVPGYPRAEAEALCKNFGYEDKLIVTGEYFHLWVIEAPDFVKNELPFHKAGLNVVWTNDMEPYRTRKVRVLNGAHTAGTLTSHLAGHTYVKEMVEDSDCGDYVRRLIFEEILPTLDLEQSDKEAYANAILERFANPFIQHALLSISLNSVSKWKVRLLPTLQDYIRITGVLPKRICLSLAALIRFYKATTKNGTTEGQVDGVFYTIQDKKEILFFFENVWQNNANDIHKLVQQVLGNTDLWDQDLNKITGLTDLVTEDLKHMLHDSTQIQ